jgi:hypothetical protein
MSSSDCWALWMTIHPRAAAAPRSASAGTTVRLPPLLLHLPLRRRLLLRPLRPPRSSNSHSRSNSISHRHPDSADVSVGGSAPQGAAASRSADDHASRGGPTPRAGPTPGSPSSSSESAGSGREASSGWDEGDGEASSSGEESSGEESEEWASEEFESSGEESGDEKSDGEESRDGESEAPRQIQGRVAAAAAPGTPATAAQAGRHRTAGAVWPTVRACVLREPARRGLLSRKAAAWLSRPKNDHTRDHGNELLTPTHTPLNPAPIPQHNSLVVPTHQLEDNNGITPTQ